MLEQLNRNIEFALSRKNLSIYSQESIIQYFPLGKTQENKVRSPKDNNYFKYCTVYSNPIEQYWYNQGMMIPAWLEIVNGDITNLY